MTASKTRDGSPELHGWLRDGGVGVLIYVLVTLFTNAHFMADTAGYVESMVSYNEHRYDKFWEFGHVLWRPLGWVLMRAAFPLTRLFVGNDWRLNGTLVLLVVSWIAGLISVLSLAAILKRFGVRRWILIATLVALVLSHGFLNYAQTGAPYMLSLSLMFLALYLLLRNDKGRELRPRDAVLAGMVIAGMVTVWFPFVMAVPGILCAPLLFLPPAPRRVKLLGLCAVVAGALASATYLGIATRCVGVRSVADFRHWMQETTAQSAQDKGLVRAVFGFARSFIFMGNDGMRFKRYLIHDPFNPVSKLDLLRLSLWKFLLFYMFLGSMLLNLLRSDQGRRLLALFVLTAGPVLGLAVYWQGGDVERYLALYPVLFLALGASLASARSLRVLNGVVLLFVIASGIVNARAMSLTVLNAEQDALVARVRDLNPLLKPASRVFVVNYQDELMNFSRSFPFNPINRSHNLTVAGVVEIGGAIAPRWRQDFAKGALQAWNEGGDVWLTRRALSARPQADWNWVEGDDRRVSWTDVHGFFLEFEKGESVGGADGFVRLPPSEKNRLLLSQMTADPQLRTRSDLSLRERRAPSVRRGGAVRLAQECAHCERATPSALWGLATTRGLQEV